MSFHLLIRPLQFFFSAHGGCRDNRCAAGKLNCPSDFFGSLNSPGDRASFTAVVCSINLFLFCEFTFCFSSALIAGRLFLLPLPLFAAEPLSVPGSSSPSSREPVGFEPWNTPQPFPVFSLPFSLFVPFPWVSLPLMGPLRLPWGGIGADQPWLHCQLWSLWSQPPFCHSLCHAHFPTCQAMAASKAQLQGEGS